MALLHMDFFSEVLGKSVNMDVILPQNTTKQIGMKGTAGNGKIKTVYLLHGMSDDQTTWQRRTSIERYVSEYGIAVVMPNADLAFYTDTQYGLLYWTFFSRELPKICHEFFPQLSEKREDTLAAGLSMGGYGAWKLGLGASDIFGSAASLSGVLDIARRMREEAENIFQKPQGFWEGIFGDLDCIEGSVNDLKYLAKKVKEDRKPIPRLYAWCGTEDFLYRNNIDMWKEMESLGFEVATETSKGDHQWKYWDQQIQKILKWWLE